MFGDVFGLHPWDVDRLTIEQFNTHAKYAHEKSQRSREAG